MNSCCKDGLNGKAISGNLDFEGLPDVYINFLSEMTKQLSRPNMNLLSGHTKGSIRNEEYENLEVSLEATQLRLEEEKARNKLLEERLRTREMQQMKFEEHALELERKENTIACAQELNAEMAENMYKTKTAIAELRVHYKGIIVSLEHQLNDARMDIEGFHETIDQMSKKLTLSENQIASLELLLEEKDKQKDEMKKQMKAIQTEIDATIIEKFELESKIHDMKKETDEQKNKIAELLNDNQELSDSLHNREEESASLEIEVVQAEKALEEKEAENGKLMQQIEESTREISCLKDFEKRYKLANSKLCDAKYELKQREEALERLANHLAATVEGNLCENSLEAAGQFLVSLKWNEKR